MSTFYVEQFEEKFKELINDLHSKFEDNLEILVYYKSLDKLDYKKIAIHFATELQNYSEFITKKNDNLFTNENINFIDQIKFNEIWLKLEIADKTVIWQYIQILYILSNIIADIPKKCEIPENNSDLNLNNTINDVMKTMKDNFESTDKQSINLTDMTTDDINEATQHVKEKLNCDNNGGNNVMMDMIGEINKELINVTENPDQHVEDAGESNNNPQIDMMSQMLNIDKQGLNGIMSIANKISQQFQSKVDSGELNPQDLMASAQSMLMNMQNIQK